MQSRRIQILLLIRDSSFDYREFDLVGWFEAGEINWEMGARERVFRWWCDAESF